MITYPHRLGPFRFALNTALLVGGLIGIAPYSSAVINLGDPLGTATAPTGMGGQPDDPGFYSVGRVTNAVLGSAPVGSGVYLGNGWVITANHVNGRTFVTQSGTYAWDGVNSHRIGGTDLRIFKLSTNPTEAAIPISTSRPSDGEFTVMVGAGRSPEASSTTWYVDTSTWTWSETFFAGADTTADGYKTTSTRVSRWGTNEIISTGTTTYAGANTLATDFSSSGTTYEAQAVQNDSGGAFFVETAPGDWRLAGLIVTVSVFPNQPDTQSGIRTAVEGNQTIAIDLSDYATEINSMIPEPGTLPLFAALIALGFVTLTRRRTPNRRL